MGISEVGKELMAEGHSLEVASCSDRPEDSWVQQFSLPVKALGPGYGFYSYSPRLLPWLRNNLHRFDAVIVNGLWQYQGLAVYRVSRSSAKPYFVFTHGMLDPWSRRRHPVKYLKKFLYWTAVEYHLLRNAAGVFFTGTEEARLAQAYFPFWKWRSVPIAYGVAPPPGNPKAQVERFLESFPSLKGKRVLLSLSRIHPKKGLDDLLRAFSKVSASRPDIHLVIAGSGHADYERKLKELALTLGLEDKVTWTGFVDGDLKWGAYHYADVFVLPSHQENFGLSVAEALACGKPVLITDKVNIWRDIVADHAGLVGGDNAESITSLLLQWMSIDPSKKAELSANALKCYQNRFSASMAANDISRAIKSVLDSPNTQKVATAP
jgi:glycosyltransferase involved in cell wall biosynthesis